MNTLCETIIQALKTSDTEIKLRRLPDDNRIHVTTVRHLSGINSEHDLVLQNQHCRIVNIYRNGRKAGMQLITHNVVAFCQYTASGNITGEPSTGHSVASEPLNDST